MEKRFKRISISKVKTPKGYVVTSVFRTIEEDNKVFSPMDVFPMTNFDGAIRKTPNLSYYDGDWRSEL